MANHLDVPLQVTDSAGNVVWAVNYNAFGRADVVTPRSATGDSRINSQLRLPGQYEDIETGLHYNFHRYYNHESGRYIQKNPIGLAGGMNAYAYVGGNPLSRIDPLGLAVCTYSISTHTLICVPNNGGDPLTLGPNGV